MTPEEKNILFKGRFLQKSFGTFLSQRGEYEKLIRALSDDDVQRLYDMNVFFCRSYAPSSVTELRNTPALEVMQLIIFEGEYLRNLLPEEVVAIILHEIGHVFNPHLNLQQREFNADDFAISKGYGKYIKISLVSSIQKEPHSPDNQIKQARIARILN